MKGYYDDVGFDWYLFFSLMWLPFLPTVWKPALLSALITSLPETSGSFGMGFDAHCCYDGCGFLFGYCGFFVFEVEFDGFF